MSNERRSFIFRETRNAAIIALIIAFLVSWMLPGAGLTSFITAFVTWIVLSLPDIPE